jgi:hypothetical protein
MRNYPYSQIARSAAQCEESGSLSEGAVLWHQASEIAVLDANRDWSAHRANVCKIRMMRLAKAARVRNGGVA